MNKVSWLNSAAMATLVSVVAVFLSAIQYQEIPIGAVIGAAMIFIATRYIRNTKNSFWQSSLVIVIW